MSDPFPTTIKLLRLKEYEPLTKSVIKIVIFILTLFSIKVFVIADRAGVYPGQQLKGFPCGTGNKSDGNIHKWLTVHLKWFSTPVCSYFILSTQLVTNSKPQSMKRLVEAEEKEVSYLDPSHSVKLTD